MFLLHCRISKGSVIASYQLVLKKEYALADLTRIMQDYLRSNDGKLGLFEVNVDSITFSGKLISKVYDVGNYVRIKIR